MFLKSMKILFNHENFSIFSKIYGENGRNGAKIFDMLEPEPHKNGPVPQQWTHVIWLMYIVQNSGSGSSKKYVAVPCGSGSTTLDENHSIIGLTLSNIDHGMHYTVRYAPYMDRTDRLGF
jgi:hypothetical protein